MTLIRLILDTAFPTLPLVKDVVCNVLGSTSETLGVRAATDQKLAGSGYSLLSLACASLIDIPAGGEDFER